MASLLSFKIIQAFREALLRKQIVPFFHTLIMPEFVFLPLTSDNALKKIIVKLVQTFLLKGTVLKGSRYSHIIHLVR